MFGKNNTTFDGIIGHDFLMEVNATIDLREKVIRSDAGTEIIHFMNMKMTILRKLKTLRCLLRGGRTS